MGAYSFHYHWIDNSARLPYWNRHRFNAAQFRMETLGIDAKCSYNKSGRNSLMKRMSRFLAVIFLVPAIAGCAGTPALHVIGVYEGKPPEGTDDRPWWAKCNTDQIGGQSNTADLSSIIECHQKHAGANAEKEVVVNISDDTQPLVLALTAYDRTHWKVIAKKGVKIVKVILAGYHSQRVSGIPVETLIEAYTHDPSPCERCWQSEKYFYSYKAPSPELREITGLEATSFQGRYKGTEFAIFPGIRKQEIEQ